VFGASILEEHVVTEGTSMQPGPVMEKVNLSFGLALWSSKAISRLYWVLVARDRLGIMLVEGIERETTPAKKFDIGVSGVTGEGLNRPFKKYIALSIDAMELAVYEPDAATVKGNKA
jgi:hypothetical protein